MMKTLFFLTFILCSTLIYSQTDVLGFRESRWCTSVDSVKNLFNSELTIMDKPADFSDSYLPFYIAFYKIDGINYKVTFVFSKKTNGLIRVNLQPERTSQFVISSIESLLVGKYGTPAYKSEDPLTRIWKFNSTIIELKIVPLANKLILTYTPPEKNESSKL